MLPRTAIAAFLIVLVQEMGCASLGPPKADIAGTVDHRVTHVVIGAGSLDLHVAQRVPVTPRAPLVIFGSGDGGWFGSAIGMFDTIAAAGYPVAGISSRSLLRTVRAGGQPISSTDIAEAYRRIIGTSRAALHVEPGIPVIVAGWSRGAALSVIVGAEDRTDEIAGVIAIGLAADEDLNVDLQTDDDVVHRSTEPSAGPIDNYVLIGRVQHRVALIQASGDAYLSAVQAHALFGADSLDRRFFTVPASNHRFRGGGTAFRSALGQALHWISFEESTPE